VGLTRLFPVPPATLREVVQRLDDPGLAPAWTDDTTLGWVYQYWNDPEREALDAKLNDGGKIEPHEIASKTQMFTERYMVEWLLQNSLGLTWLCMCRKHGWTADAERVLPVLDTRRAEWRKKRDAGEVALDALVPIEGELEEHWKYYVPQPIPDDAVASAPDSIRTLKLLDPACGSGHFLVIAFDLLAAMYREEARHRGDEMSDREIAESILENNLHGIDIDPRAVQIAAAAVVLKAKRLAPNARPQRVNLVAPVLRLGNLNEDDPALVRLRHELRAEAGIPEELTNKLVKSLAGVDHLGSLLKVDAAIDDAIREQERVGKLEAGQGDLLSGRFPVQQAKIDWDVTRATLLDRLEGFLARHTAEEDLGLRLDGEQLAAGVRFVRMAKEGVWDVVVGNPPFSGVSLLTEQSYIRTNYDAGKSNLYSAFMLRAMRLAKPGGLVALLSIRGWLFLVEHVSLRDTILEADLRLLLDIDRGGFEAIPDEQVAVALFVVRAARRSDLFCIALQPTDPRDKSRDSERTSRKRSAVMVQVGRNEFGLGDIANIEGKPLVYWWSAERIQQYVQAPKFGTTFPARKGLCTGDDTRFHRYWWEVEARDLSIRRTSDSQLTRPVAKWVPTIKGGKSRRWIEPLGEIQLWGCEGLQVRVLDEISGSTAVRNPQMYFVPGVAFSMIGQTFAARAHRYRSVFGDMGSSVFPANIAGAVCSMNTAQSRSMMESLNPTTHFQVGDVNRLPVFHVADAHRIFSRVSELFAAHEAARENSIEFRAVGCSGWASVQEWAQRSVDRTPGVPLQEENLCCEPPTSADWISCAIGVAMGRFGPNGEGALDRSAIPPLTAAILFVSDAAGSDSLTDPACTPIHAAWSEHGRGVGQLDDLRTWLRTAFFKHHKALYENRPIYFPLSSAKKSFVAWVSIHRWTSSTLTTLLADHLVPERRRLEGELDDLRKARAKPEKGSKASAERRFADVQKLLAELNEFIDLVIQCAERGPPPTWPGETQRETDARYEMDLDDGVMVNSAALWPLLEPQWKDPKKWWKELAEAKGRKDYDWAHLAKRYFPSRVEAKCVEDPSLAVAHGCFWRLHPAKAYAWELRLQDEIRPDFTIEEPGSDEARARFLAERAEDARAIQLKEAERRERKARKAGEKDWTLALDLDEAEAEQEAEEVE
jgi:hypothetical protein